MLPYQMLATFLSNVSYDPVICYQRSWYILAKILLHVIKDLVTSYRKPCYILILHVNKDCVKCYQRSSHM